MKTTDASENAKLRDALQRIVAFQGYGMTISEAVVEVRRIAIEALNEGPLATDADTSLRHPSPEDIP